jgi:hypothetical protein
MVMAIRTETVITIFLVLLSIFGIFLYHFGEVESKIMRNITAQTGINR